MSSQEDRGGAARDGAGRDEDNGSEPETDGPAQQPAPEQPAPEQEEVPAPGAWEAVEQLFALAPHLRAGRANVMGDTRVSGDVVAGDKHIGVHLHGEASARLRPSGPVPGADLERVVQTFAPSRRYDELCAELAESRVLVLRGRRGTGRRTAALRMLSQVTKGVGDVIALDPGTEPADFADHVLPGRAHFVTDPPAVEDGPLRDVHLHAVRRRLADSGGFFVVVASPGAVLDGVEGRDWVPPRPADVVRAHLEHMIGSAGRSPSAEPAEIQRLLEMEVTVGFLSAGPAPHEAAGFARLLVEYVNGRCGTEELAGYGRTSADRVVDSWFGRGGPGGEIELRDKAFLISLAAFDGSPYPLVADLGDGLYRQLLGAEEPDRPAGHPVFGTCKGDRLALAGALEYDDETDTRWGRVPEPVVAFENGHLWSAVLRHVWTSHPAVRSPMLDWLDVLVADRRSLVRLRGAVTAGVLAAADFEYGFDAFLTRWASSKSLMERQLASWALYTAAEHGMDTVVRRLLSGWSRQHDQGRRWTAARTYALLGGATAATALRDIGRMTAAGPAPDAALQTALEQTVDALLQGPAGPAVVEQLVEWHGGRGPLRELAAAGFLRGTRRRRYEPGSHGAWPRLLRLADQEAPARRHIVALWRGLLGDRVSRDAAREGLTRWVRAAETASARSAAAGHTVPSDIEQALGRLLPELVTTANERERLDYLLRRYGDGTGLPSAAAARLRAALPGRPSDSPLTI
ncbi:hypothetical protein ACFCZ1_26075 [Streptomyces sp. NPDC056224]|uniref:hypothetical protein n=1 Tax=Streptomyces sp. NPDC056224 TaxID=3345750 RepID=UPI0035DE66FE